MKAYKNYVEWKLLLESETDNLALKDLLLARELYYNNAFRGDDHKLDEFITNVFVKESNHSPCVQAEVYKACDIYARYCVKKNRAITSADIISMNEAFFT